MLQFMANPSRALWGATASRGWLAVVVAVGLLGCNEEEHKKQLADVQAQADQKIASIESKAKERVSFLEKEIETLKAEATKAAEQAKADAEALASKTQASLDDAEKEAAKLLDKARSAYKTEAKARYQALNTDLAEVTGKANKIPAKSKAAYDKSIKTVLALQKDITKDIAAYDDATLDTFGKVKAKVDTDLAKYKAAIKAAKAKLPKS
jgi:hypothetical protein